MSATKKWWRRRRPYLISAIVYYLVRMVAMTLRVTISGRDKIQDDKRAKIFCGWHGKTFLPANHFKGKGLYALFSLSHDGELQSRIFRKFGFKVIRGSSGRDGARAAVEAIRVLRDGESMAITPDGPRGPAEKVQDGVLLMAQKSGAVLVPGGSAAKPCFRVGTWDRYMIPWPFSKAAIVYGDPIEVPPGADLTEVRSRLQAAISEAETKAETLVGNKPLAANPVAAEPQQT